MKYDKEIVKSPNGNIYVITIEVDGDMFKHITSSTSKNFTKYKKMNKLYIRQKK